MYFCELYTCLYVFLGFILFYGSRVMKLHAAGLTFKIWSLYESVENAEFYMLRIICFIFVDPVFIVGE